MQSLLEAKCCCPFTSFPPIILSAHLQMQKWIHHSAPHDPLCSLALTTSPPHHPSSLSISGASPPRSIVVALAVIGSSHHHQEPRKNPVGSGSKAWVHFIGIGGAGLSALAFFALKQVTVASLYMWRNNAWHLSHFIDWQLVKRFNKGVKIELMNWDTFCALKEIKNTSNKKRLPMKFDILNALKEVYKKHFGGEKLPEICVILRIESK